jgi:hypothetical protein
MDAVGLRVSGELTTSFQYQASDASATEGQCGAQAHRTRSDDQYFGVVAHFDIF